MTLRDVVLYIKALYIVFIAYLRLPICQKGPQIRIPTTNVDWVRNVCTDKINWNLPVLKPATPRAWNLIYILLCHPAISNIPSKTFLVYCILVQMVIKLSFNCRLIEAELITYIPTASLFTNVYYILIPFKPIFSVENLWCTLIRPRIRIRVQCFECTTHKKMHSKTCMVVVILLNGRTYIVFSW